MSITKKMKNKVKNCPSTFFFVATYNKKVSFWANPKRDFLYLYKGKYLI